MENPDGADEPHEHGHEAVDGGESVGESPEEPVETKPEAEAAEENPASEPEGSQPEAGDAQAEGGAQDTVPETAPEQPAVDENPEPAVDEKPEEVAPEVTPEQPGEPAEEQRDVTQPEAVESTPEETVPEPEGDVEKTEPASEPLQPEEGNERAVEGDTVPETAPEPAVESHPEPAIENPETAVDEKPVDEKPEEPTSEVIPQEPAEENAEIAPEVTPEQPVEPVSEGTPEEGVDEPITEEHPTPEPVPETPAETLPAETQPEAVESTPEETVPEPEGDVENTEQPAPETSEPLQPEGGEGAEQTPREDEGAQEEEPESKPAKAKVSPKLSIPLNTTQSESTQGDKGKATDKKRVAKTRDELKKAREDKEKRRYAAHLEEKNKENTTTLTLPAGHAALRSPKRTEGAEGEVEEEFIEESLPPPRRLFEIIETIEITEPHNIIPLPADTVTADILRAAMALVKTKARETVWEGKKLVVPQDDRVLGQCDMIKAALSIPGLDESNEAVKAMFAKWLFKLQLAYVRYSWSWKIAIKFKTHLKIEEVFLETDEFIKELETMQLTVEPEKQPPIVETFEKNYCTRLTRAKSRGLNMKLEFNYFKTPLPLEKGLKVPEDKFWEVLHEELWHNPISPNAPIVIDSGSRFTKVGTASMEIPHYVIPSLCAINRANETKKLCGYQALTEATDAKKWKINKVFDPMEPDWDSALLMWEYMFNDLLQVDATQFPVMMTETPDMSVIGREETYEIMFEHFNVPMLYIGNSALMSLYAMGALNGLVIDIGNRMQIIPINDGVIEKHATTQLKKGVTNTSKYMADLLQDKGYYFQTAREMDEIRKMKEKSCYLAVDYDAELLKPESSLIYKYNSVTKGRVIEIGRERFKCPEILFSPSKLGILDNDFSLQNLIIQAIMACGIDTRVNLFSNMMLVGGGTLIPGLSQRIEEEVFKSLVGEHGMKAVRRSNIKCHAAPNRKYLPWKGASIFCTTDGWEDRATRLDDYYEIGKAQLAEKTMFT